MKEFLRKRIFFIVEMVIMCSILIFCDAKTVFAGSAYVPRTTAPASNNSYYYGSKNVFYTSGYGMPNCTAYAYGRAYELLGSKPSLCTGNAGQWYSYNAKHNYYKYGSTPKLGAIACWDNYDSNQGHVAVVERVNSDGTILISESHWRGTVFDTRTIKSNSSNYLTSKRFLGYIYIGDWGDGGGYKPEGVLDSLTGGTGCLSARGWAFDQDDKSKALQIHIYIGGEAGSGAEGHVIIADKYRPDVGAACQGVGNYHGFDEKIYTTRTGKQDVYVYAINIGAEDYNTCLGKKTVTITKDTTKPVISDVKVTNITKTGYTVTFKASDNVGITRFWLPTWADPQGQDDLKDEPYTKSGDTYTIQVKRSDHNNACGIYYTHIYAYDAAGNEQKVALDNISLLHYEVTDPAVSATCTTAGKTAGKHCSVCKKVITAQQTVPAKGHTEVVDPAVSATCTTAGKTAGKHCSVCKKVITAQQIIPAKGHTEVIDPAVSATCTTAGKTAGKHCSVCKKVITAQQTVPAKGHTEVVDPAVSATCTTAGKTEGKHCSVCNKVITAQQTVPAKGHTEVIDPAVSATCTTAGKTEGKHCSVCNKVITAQQTVPAKGHTEVVDPAVAPTCTATGKTEGKHCSVCNKVITAPQTVPAKGHTEVVDPAVAPTCTATGKTAGKHCSVCNAVITAQQTVPAKGHTEVVDPAVAPTCTATGETEGKHCSVCNKVITEQQTVPAKGHTEVVDPAVAPTCTATGKTAGKHCSVCNKVITAQQTIPAKGHTEVVDPAVSATCTTAGKTEGKHCSVCNKVITAQQTVPAKGHIEVIDPAVSATCTTAGKTEGKHCSVCNAVITAQQTVPAKGHAYGNGVVTKEATEYATGILTYTCSGCSHKKTAIIPVKTPQPQEQPSIGTPSVPNRPTAPQKPEEAEKPSQNTRPKDEALPQGTVLRDKMKTGAYRVTSSGAVKREVAYAGAVKKGATVKVPNTVVLEGVQYEVTSIAPRAFAGNKKLKKVIIGANITVIGEEAFDNCVNLQSVALGKNVREIGNKAFYKCSKLKKIKIPARVEKIGKQAFYGCKKLSQITIQTKKLSAKKVGQKAFGKIHDKATIKVPESKMKTYKKLLNARGVSTKAKIKKAG